ncbi:hypothetical protein BaRGS_00037855 [Batillaria attramentaria]|uniref:Uncharacterized protein n=1 Tax=Batillaria attramentaria TaxID=370345 RepID=A0ABD0J7E2_9CAEN
MRRDGGEETERTNTEKIFPPVYTNWTQNGVLCQDERRRRTRRSLMARWETLSPSRFSDGQAPPPTPREASSASSATSRSTPLPVSDIPRLLYGGWVQSAGLSGIHHSTRPNTKYIHSTSG